MSSGTGTLTVEGDEVLTTEPTTNAGDYSITVMEGGTGGDGDEGDVIDITEHATTLAVSGSSGGSITVTSASTTALAADDKIKIIYAVTKDVANNNVAKTFNKSRGVKVTTDDTAVYGTNYKDEIITLGVPDVYALRAVYESNGTNSLDNTDALPPMLTVASGLVGVSPGDKITGSVSGAVGRIIESKSSNTNLYFYYIYLLIHINFQDLLLEIVYIYYI